MDTYSYLASECGKYVYRVNNNTKERETISWIKNHMNKESVFWDIGANIGQYGIFASIIHKCKTYLIEPEPQNFSNLCINILLNK